MELVFERANLKLPNKLSNALRNVLHPVFGLLWTCGAKIFVSQLTKDKKPCKTHHLSLNKGIAFCQWVLELRNILAVISEDGEVSFWKFFQNSENHFKQVATLKVQHRVDGIFQVPNQRILLLMGRNETTVVNLGGAEDILLSTCILSCGCTCCCWSDHLKCLIILSYDGHLMCFKFITTEDDVKVESFQEMPFPRFPGRLRNVIAVESFILCSFDSPLEESIRTDKDQSVSTVSTSISTEKNGTNNLQYMLNYTSELLSRSMASSSSSSSSMMRVFKVDGNDDNDSSSSSSPLSLIEVTCTTLDDVIIPDLTTTWELTPTKYLVLVGSSSCSSLSVFVFDCHKPGLEPLDSLHFEGQKVKGISVVHGGLFCLTVERPMGGDPFSFLSLGCRADENVRLLTSANFVSDMIPLKGCRKQCKSIYNNTNVTDDGDDDDDLELDESNFIIPGIFPPRTTFEGSRLIEEVEDRKHVQNRTDSTAASVCIHCGKTNSSNQESPGRRLDDVNLESLVTNVVRREFKKFKAELLDELKSFVGSEFQKIKISSEH